MKRKITFISIMSVITIIVLSAFSGTTKYPSGAPVGYTGSPSDGQNCSNCHNGTAVNATGFITSNIPVTGYIPGTTYTITCAFTGSGKKGFEISPQSISGAALGTLIAGSGTQILQNKYITHTSANNTSSASWSFQWVAPPLTTGTVTFYGACVISKPNTKLTTLVVQENNLGINNLININLCVFPNPLNEILNINYQLNVNSSVEINLFSMEGKKIETLMQNEQNQGNYSQSFDISHYQSGIYLLEFLQKNQKTLKKIIIN